jgi:hypothetical protein
MNLLENFHDPFGFTNLHGTFHGDFVEASARRFENLHFFMGQRYFASKIF